MIAYARGRSQRWRGCSCSIQAQRPGSGTDGTRPVSEVAGAGGSGAAVLIGATAACSRQSTPTQALKTVRPRQTSRGRQRSAASCRRGHRRGTGRASRRAGRPAHPATTPSWSSSGSVRTCDTQRLHGTADVAAGEREARFDTRRPLGPGLDEREADRAALRAPQATAPDPYVKSRTFSSPRRSTSKASASSWPATGTTTAVM